jgi:hypothetical protein
MKEESYRRNHGGGLMEEESWRRKSFRRNLEPSGRHLEASGRHTAICHRHRP